jgi:hypothetical protein
MQGGFFLVTHSDFSGPLGKGVETAYMGYDSKTGQYSYDSFNSLGEVDRAKGNVNGGTWTWLSDTRVGAERMKARLTQKIVSPTSYTFRFEMSRDGKTWKTVLEGRDTKVMLIAERR